MIEKTILIPILERLERIESIVSGQAKKYERMMTLKDVTAYCRVIISRFGLVMKKVSLLLVFIMVILYPQYDTLSEDIYNTFRRKI